MEELRFYSEIEKLGADDDQHMCWGYASTEAIDSDNDIIAKGAMRDAWSEYMEWGNVREMHARKAAGVVKEYRFDDRGTHIGVLVTDAEAWHKVVTKTYKGFSIGARVLSRDPDDRRRVTKLRLSEISLVDRGANPEARIELFKADGLSEETEMAEQSPEVTVEVVVDEALTKVDAATARVDEYVAKAELLDEMVEKLGGLASLLEKVGQVDRLEKALAEASEVAAKSTSDLEALSKRLEAVEAAPEAPLAVVSGVAVEKAHDGREVVADEAPTTPLAAILKAHLAPRRLGFGEGPAGA